MDIKDEDGRYHGLAVIHVKNPFRNHPNQSRRMLYSMKKKAAPHPNFTRNANVVCPRLLLNKKVPCFRMLRPVGWQHFLTLISWDFGHPVNFDMFKIHELCYFFSCPRSLEMKTHSWTAKRLSGWKHLERSSCFTRLQRYFGRVFFCWVFNASVLSFNLIMYVAPNSSQKNVHSSPPQKKGPFWLFSNLAKKSDPQFFGFPAPASCDPEISPVSRVAKHVEPAKTPNGRSRESREMEGDPKKSWKPDVKLEALPILERKRSKLV